VATSGDHSETRKTVPIARRPRSKKRVVMSMGARRLPDPRAGDRLKVTAELQVTLDCHRHSSACVGRPYLLNPRVGSRLILSSRPDVTGGPRRVAISQRRRIVCRGKPLSSRQHHCVVVFSREVLDVPSAARLPCRPRSCGINLVLDANSMGARKGNELVIGNNRPNGRVGQDKGRINVIRMRPAAQPPAPRIATRHREHRSVSLDASRTVLLSKRLPDLKENEQLAVHAAFRTDVSRLPFSARVSSHLVLARSRRSTTPGALVRRLASQGGEIDETNGANCTPIQTPCRYRKVGVVRMKKDARGRGGRPIPLYVNLYVVSKSKRVRSRPGDRLPILPHPKLVVTRYPASRHG
jgi:hypothetical protein